MPIGYKKPAFPHHIQLPILMAILFISDYVIIESAINDVVTIPYADIPYSLLANSVGLSFFGSICDRWSKQGLSYCIIILCVNITFLSFFPGNDFVVILSIASQLLSSIFILLSITSLYESVNDATSFFAFAIVIMTLFLLSRVVELASSSQSEGARPLQPSTAACIAVLLLMSLVFFRRQTFSNYSSESPLLPGLVIRANVWPPTWLWSWIWDDFDLRRVIRVSPAQRTGDRMMGVTMIGSTQYREVDMHDDCLPGDDDVHQDNDHHQVSRAAGSRTSTKTTSGTSEGNQRRAVSFSSLVSVKLIDSDELVKSEPLKRVAVDDTPLLPPPPSLRRTINDSSHLGDISAESPTDAPSAHVVPRQEQWVQGLSVRYSNGAEHNRGILSVKNSLRSQILYLIKKKDLVSSILRFGSNGLLSVFVSWAFSIRDQSSPFWVDGISLVSSFLLLLASLILFRRALAEAAGLVQAFKVGFAILISSLAFASFLSFLCLGISIHSDAVGVGGIVFIVLEEACEVIVRVGLVWTLVASIIMLNNICYKRHRALVNGLSLAVVFFFISACRAAYNIFYSLLPSSVVAALSSRTQLNELDAEDVDIAIFNANLFAAMRTASFLVLSFAAYVLSHVSRELPKTALRRKREPKTPRYCEYYGIDADDSWDDVGLSSSRFALNPEIGVEEQDEKEGENEDVRDVPVGFLGDDERSRGLALP